MYKLRILEKKHQNISGSVHDKLGFRIYFIYEYTNISIILGLLSNSQCSEITTMYNSYNLIDFYMGRSMRSAKIGNHAVSTENNELFIWNN
jgi:hypothetical protein